MRGKSANHSVIDQEHPLHNFVKQNAWLAECFGEERADGSVCVTNTKAVGALLNHLFIKGKRGQDDDEDEPESKRTSAMEGKGDTGPDSDGMLSLFDRMAKLEVKSLPSGATKRESEEEKEESKRANTGVASVAYDPQWQVPVDVVSEILYAVIDYDMTKTTPDLIQVVYDFAQNRPRMLEYLGKLSADTRKKIAFEMIKRVPSSAQMGISLLGERRELLVLGALLQLERVHSGTSASFWNMQEQGSKNTLMHYAVNNNYANLARAMYIRGARGDIPNARGLTAKDLITTYGRDPTIFSFP